ncbi:MAG: class I SAM-dependent DNA methyltransferase [Halocynthiibacter sp.]
MKSTKFWDKAAEKYAKSAISDMAGYEETRDQIRDLLQPHHRVLEIGCGTGSTALELADRVDQYVATDISPKMIDIAKSKEKTDALAHLSFETRDADQEISGSFDVILALNVLHLLPNLEEVIAGIFAALPAGGMLISKTGLLKDGAWYFPALIAVMKAVGMAPYVRHLNENDLTAVFTDAGFEVVSTLIQDGSVPRMFSVLRKPIGGS